MKMKKACEATNLTERAIRLYISKGLITPSQKDGLIDFSPEDIQHLRDIALMRHTDFTMEQIGGMIGCAEDIPAIVAARRDAARTGADHEVAVAAALTGLTAAELANLHTLADGIRARGVIPALNFAQFDEMTAEERHAASAIASKAVERQQKRQQQLRRWMIAGGVLLAVAVAASIFLTRICIKGYIAVSPVTVVEVMGDRATFRIGDAQAVEVLGRDVITVPYMADGVAPGLTIGPRISAGDVAEHACQLFIELTNFDLLRLGINPFQNVNQGGAKRHNEWMRLLLRAEFEDGASDNCTLWLRYPAEGSALLWVEN